LTPNFWKMKSSLNAQYENTQYEKKSLKYRVNYQERIFLLRKLEKISYLFLMRPWRCALESPGDRAKIGNTRRRLYGRSWLRFPLSLCL
jgi:hypothetical protein